jgi:hypothetical protein
MQLKSNRFERIDRKKNQNKAKVPLAAQHSSLTDFENKKAKKKKKFFSKFFFFFFSFSHKEKE